MGFYGNIIDRANEILKFDRTFDNRRDMDAAAAAGTDQVFPGHFVLIQYDREGQIYSGDIYTGYRDSETDIFYADSTHTKPLKYATFSLVQSPVASNWASYWERYGENLYLKIPSLDYYNAGQRNYYTASIANDNIAWQNMLIRARSDFGALSETYYKCTGSDSSGNATWTIVFANDDTYGDYFRNYAIDQAAYDLSNKILSYDATVWEKVYEDGVGKFAFVAHLNGRMPGVELFADAPSIYPTAPYMDTKSTDALYRLHVPSHWGFAFKEVDPITEGGLSEQTVTYDKKVYDSNGVDYVVTPTTINADIYLNKRAANKENRYHDETVVNEVVLSPEGMSGKRYTDINGNPVYTDTMELSVHLPAIGNAISDTYDILYGYDSTVTTPPQPRYTDIDWVSGEHTDEEKYNGLTDKKTHDLNTIAGSLNTVHDRLGQIIVPLDQWLNPNDAEYDVWIAGLNGKKCIYSYQSSPDELPSYYRLSEDFTYQDPENGTFKYEPIDFTNNTAAYQQNTFYYLEDAPFNNNVNAIMYESQSSHASAIARLKIDTNGTYTPRPNYYYYKKSIAEVAYTPVQLEFYVPNRYFLKSDTSYIRDHGINPANSATNAPTNPYAQYYYIDETNIGNSNANVRRHNFTNGYTPSSDYYYPQPGETNYLWAVEEHPNGEISYYTTVKQRYFEQQNIILYRKNLFYYSVGTGGQKQYFAMRDNTYADFQSNHQAIINDNSFTIYWLEFDDTPVITLAEIDGELQTVLSYPVKENGAHPIPRGSLVDIPAEQVIQNSYTSFLSTRPELVSAYQTLYFQDASNNYIDFRNMDDLEPAQDGTPQYAIARPYYILGLSPQQLYIPGRYYRRIPDDETGNYVISWDEWNAVEGPNINYYTIRNIETVEKPFYQPNTYYFKDSQNAAYSSEPDQTAAYSANHTYHSYYAIKQKLYVESDSSGRCPVGYEWNDDSLFIPASVVLKQLTQRLKLIEMVGMDNGMSSINGAILQLAQEYCPESKTRDTTTFRGSLNKIQDLLYTIAKLIPGKIVYINDFGQLTTGDVDYSTLLPPTTQGSYVLTATVAANGKPTYTWQNA